MDDESPNKYSFLIPEREVAPGYSAQRYQTWCLQELNKASDLTHLRELALDQIRRLGFTDFSLGRMQSPNPEAAMIMLTWDAGMVDPYKDPDVWAHDMVLQYAKSNTSPIYQSRINKFINSADFITEPIRSNRYCQEIVQGYGYFDYFNLPLPAARCPLPAANGNGNVLLALTTKNAEPERFQLHAEKNKDAIAIFAKALDFVATRRFPKSYLGADEKQNVIIADRPLQLLATIAHGDMQLKEAAEALGIRLSTANQHIRAAKNALGRAESAIHRATVLGLI